MRKVIQMLSCNSLWNNGFINKGSDILDPGCKVVKFIERERKASDMLTVNFLRRSDGRINTVVGKECWVFGYRVDNVKAATGCFAVSDKAFWVSRCGWSLIVGLFIIPRDTLNLVAGKDWNGLSKCRDVQVNGLIDEGKLTWTCVGVVVAVSWVFNDRRNFEHNPPGDGLTCSVETELGFHAKDHQSTYN